VQCTWGFPQTLIGLIKFLSSRKKEYKVINFHGAVTTLHTESWGGVSLGGFIFCNSVKGEERTKDYIIHEFGHTVQSLILGPLFIFVIGIPSMLWCNTKKCQAIWKAEGHSYYDLYCEKWANYLGQKYSKEKLVFPD
jgi:hypothetical protein